VYVCVQDGSPQQSDSVVQADSAVQRLCCETAVRDFVVKQLFEDSVVKRLFEEGAQKLLEKRRFCSCRTCYTLRVQHLPRLLLRVKLFLVFSCFFLFFLVFSCFFLFFLAHLDNVLGCGKKGSS
jgi:hypothetical protein